ncbi:AMP-binding protein [Roseibium suaedae]|uniref:Amino acid adenylation domain-containing protein n=1 Tax=Roseibium suaedae TaxID=735517 RepID=A0A1M7MV58_9HYPH|nr:AMP-binding protein [Roseibium suaedae]SHM95008.1 amino acid adenylation domain-containing protein [Roseibium suaedae]
MVSELTSLQRAYLLGRGEHVPLGGVAMQEFREYRGALDLALFEERLHRLAESHESLRTVIDADTASSHVLENPVLSFSFIDLGGLSAEAAERELERRKQDFTHKLFDLATPPWQVIAFRLPETKEGSCDSHALFFRFDALVLDGHSIAALMKELFEDTGGGAAVPGQVQAEKAPAPEAIEADAAYWRRKLASYDGPPELPWKATLETIRTSRYERAGLSIGKDRFSQLTRLGAKAGLFRNSTLSAVILEVLSLWVSEGDLYLGVPAAPRSAEGYANRSTFFALRWGKDRDVPLAERAALLQRDVLEGLEHLAFSGVAINRHLMEAGASGRGVALPVVLTNGLGWPVLDPGAAVRLHDNLTQTPQVAMDIRLSLAPDGGLSIDIDYAVEALDRAVIEDILSALDKAVTQICESGALHVEARCILDLGHYRFNEAEDQYAPGFSLQKIADHLFTAASGQTALIHGSDRISYKELGRGVHKALTFLDQRNITRGQVVILALPRSPEQTMIMLACALRGIIWVPVDASAPQERRKFMFGNCIPGQIIGIEAVEGYEVISPATVLAQEGAGDPFALIAPLQDLSSSPDAAYYLYTSGTTGKPKCVVLSNRSTDNVITSTNREWEITSGDVFLSVSPLHHDMSVYEVLGCLTAGATLVQPVQGEEKDAVRWNQLIAEHGVTIWSSVPTILEMLLSCRQGTELDSLRLINQGGDYLKPAVIAELRRTNPSARLSSIGGPTETTIWSIWHRICPEDTGNIPYGRPLPATSYFVLNERGDHCPTGVVGRIHSSGVSTALGYLEQGALHQHDFITITDEHGETMRAFRSGDRGKYRPDGLILFDSRVQGYIKVRGVRISIPDVENALVTHPHVARILLADLGDERRGETELGALYEPVAGADLTDADLRNYARQHLQESHIPSRFLKVDSIPLSANGKPDRRRARELLSASSPRQPSGGSETALPGSRVLDIYLDVVGQGTRPAADGATDFLTLGLLPSHLKQISSRLSEEFGVALPPRELLRCRNANQVEQLVAAGRS